MLFPLSPSHLPRLHPHHQAYACAEVEDDQDGEGAFHANLVNVLSESAHEIGLTGFASQPFRFNSQASRPYTRLMGAVPMA